MALFNKLYGIKDSANMQLISLKTGRVVLEIEQPNSVEQSWSNTGVTEARNHGSRAIVWDGKKEGTITANVEVINSELLAIMSTAELKKEAIDLALELSTKVIEKNIDKEKNKELIDEFITEVGN